MADPFRRRRKDGLLRYISVQFKRPGEIATKQAFEKAETGFSIECLLNQ
jgi:hypothetical protein